MAVKYRRVTQQASEFVRYTTRHMPTELLKVIKKYAVDEGMNTEEAIVELLRKGMVAKASVN